MKYSVYCLVLALFVLSCKDKTPTQPGNEKTPTGTLLFHLHTYIENNEVDLLNAVYTTDEGRKISVGLAQFYVSDIKLTRLDGTVYELSDRKILKVFDTDIYLIGEVPVGNYRTISFAVGLDSATNASDPLNPRDSAILNKPAMWFGASAQPEGYVFMNVRGKIDTTADASGSTSQMQPFSYRIGTGAHYTPVTMPDKPFTILEGQIEYAHVLADYNTLFSGINLSMPANLSVITVQDNATAAGKKVAANMKQMFRYEE